MSNEKYWEDEDGDENLDLANQGEDSGIKNLRKAKRADEKYIKQLEAELGKYIAEDYERTVNEVLKSKGVSTKAARLIIKDLDEVNEETVSNWLTEHGDLIGYAPNQEKSVDQENLRALKQQDELTQGAATPAYSEDIERALINATSEEEIMQIIKSIA